MIISPRNVDIANRLRQLIQASTETVSDGEGVAMTLLWGFLTDHARVHSANVEDLARDQLQCFIEYARANLSLVQHH